MHTFKKITATKYEIGHNDVITSNASTWTPLFYTDTIAHAIGAVSLLNGGGNVAPSFHPLDTNGQDIKP